MGGVILRWKRSQTGTSLLHTYEANLCDFCICCSLNCCGPACLPADRVCTSLCPPPMVEVACLAAVCPIWELLLLLLLLIPSAPISLYITPRHLFPSPLSLSPYLSTISLICTHCHLNRSWDQDQESKGLLSYEEQANNDNLWNLNQFWLVSPCSAMWLSLKKIQAPCRRSRENKLVFAKMWEIAISKRWLGSDQSDTWPFLLFSHYLIYCSNHFA